jgi:hypothetical protein
MALFGRIEPGQLTPIPLAYGVFCAAFDFCMAAHFYTRRLDCRVEGAAVRTATPIVF